MSVSINKQLQMINSVNGKARLQALQAMFEVQVQATSLVSYESQGSVLVIGDGHRYDGLQEALAVLKTYTTPQVTRLEGHMGAFKAYLLGADKEHDLPLLRNNSLASFDLVLDLSQPPIWQREMQPFGYFAPSDEVQAAEALEQIKELQGEFEKPKFFEYNPEICAHGRSGISACRRCIDACPAEAISSLAERISVDPFLCQGGGSCATVCPSGAITYAYPRLNDSLNRIRRLLKVYQESGGTTPVLLLHDNQQGKAELERQLAKLPDYVLPYAVEEIGSLGMEAWLATLGAGARQILVLISAGQTKIHQALSTQLVTLHSLLEGLGLERGMVAMVTAQSLDGVLGEAPPTALADMPAASFMLLNDKRYVLRMSLEHLYQHAPLRPEQLTLPPGAPFGQVQVDRSACTLCMSCVSVCPAQALSDGNDVPQLNFHESACLQCGLCSKACPERAIQLEPRYVFRSDWAEQKRVLHEEEPFHCVGCGKPFATKSVLEKIQARLGSHHMFQTEQQRRRLQMCEDCRVRDLLASEMNGES